MNDEPRKVVVIGAGSSGVAQQLAALRRELQGQVVFLTEDEAKEQGLIPEPIRVREIPELKALDDFPYTQPRAGKGERKRNKGGRWR